MPRFPTNAQLSLLKGLKLEGGAVLIGFKQNRFETLKVWFNHKQKWGIKSKTNFLNFTDNFEPLCVKQL